MELEMGMGSSNYNSKSKSRFKTICVFSVECCGNRPVYRDATVDLAQQLDKEVDSPKIPHTICLVIVGSSMAIGLQAQRNGPTSFTKGGYGTLEQLLEVITGSQLGIHDKPVGLLNVDGYYNLLLDLIDMAVDEGFINPNAKHIIVSAPNARELMQRLEDYKPIHEGIAPRHNWERDQEEGKYNAQENIFGGPCCIEDKGSPVLCNPYEKGSKLDESLVEAVEAEM